MQSYPCFGGGVTDKTGASTVIQFVADNMDHNIRTLDGLGTFHGMGVIAATLHPYGSFSNVAQVV